MIKKRVIKCLLWLVPFIILTSCEDFVEPDISKEEITIYSPQDSLKTSVPNQLFWWKPVEHATKYQLRIVAPSFANIQSLLADTNVTDDKFEFTFSPGNYQWSIRAFNNTSHTDTIIVQTIIIDSSYDISSSKVQFQAPVDNFITNDSTLSFEWTKLYNADDYRFEIRDLYDNLITNPVITTDDNITIPSSVIPVIIGDGEYKWGVQAQNSVSSSLFNWRYFEIDKTPPDEPVLLAPANNAIMNDTLITFSWQHGNTTGSSIHDSLYIYETSVTDPPIIMEELYNTFYTDSLGLGVFYWKVISIDAAGNRSNYSEVRKLTIQ